MTNTKMGQYKRISKERYYFNKFVFSPLLHVVIKVTGKIADILEGKNEIQHKKSQEIKR